jgi:hypothetical protein
MSNAIPTLFRASGTVAVLLLLRLSLSLGQSSIVSFSDSACKQQNPDVSPSSIIFDAASPECLVVRNDTAIPTVSSLSVTFYGSKESCDADSPILLNYTAKNPMASDNWWYYNWIWPQTPPFPHPDSNQNMAFCWDSLVKYATTAQKFNLSIELGYQSLPVVRSSLGSAGAEWRFLCALKPNVETLDHPPGPGGPGQTPLKPWLYAKMFIQYVGTSLKFSIKVSNSTGSSFSAYNFSFEQCPPDTCCKTGTGQKSIYFKVPKSSINFAKPVIVYGKVLSCASGNLMFQTFSDNKCETGKNNVPWVLKADDTCQKAPSSNFQLSDYANTDTYGSFYKAQCNGQRNSPAASVTVKGWSDSSCTRPNEDVSPSPVTCDSTKCCLIARRYGVNFLRGGAAQYFKSDSECQINSFAPIDKDTNFNPNGVIAFKIIGLPYQGMFSPPVQGTNCGASNLDCGNFTAFPFLANKLENIFPRKQTLLFCIRQDRNGVLTWWSGDAPTFYIGYVAQYTGNGQWSFDVRLFRDQDCKQQIFVDTTLYPPDKPGQMCATDRCCKVGNSSASFYVRFPSRFLTYKNTSDDVYANLLSCDGNAAMFYQFDDSACTKSSYLPRFLRADGSCSAVPTQEYAIDSFYTATCGSSTVPLVQSVTVSAYSDSKCVTLDNDVKPSTKTCNLNECCEIRYASASKGALYGRALACSNNVLLFNKYYDSKCSIAEGYMPLALRSDGTCQVEATGYTSFYKASCILAPVSTPVSDLPCPKDSQGNVCGGSTYGECVQQKLPSGKIIPVCRCVENIGKFDGKVCVSAEVYATVIAAVNRSFAEDQQQMDRLQALSCKDSKTPFKCPTDTWVATQNSGQCQTSMAACASSAAAFRTYLQSLAGACSGSTPIFDSILLKCVAKDRPPMAVFACPPNQMRCADSTCGVTCSAVQAPECPAASAGKFVCPGNQVICAASLAECSQKQPWNGCPVNQFQCPSRPGVCVAALQNCGSAPGPCVLCYSFRCVACTISYCRYRFSCPDPNLSIWCGNVRDSAGKLVLDSNGNAQSICAASSSSSKCPGVPNWGAKAVPQTQSVAPYTAVTIKAVQDDNTQIASLEISADTIQTASTTFAVSPVADSVYQAGVFSKLFAAGRLRSPLISIKPNLIVDTRSSGVTLTMVVDVPSDKCLNATANMQVWLPFMFANWHYHAAKTALTILAGFCDS